MFSLLGLGEQKFIKMVLVCWPRWPSCPYMIECLRKSSSQEPRNMESWNCETPGQLWSYFIFSLLGLGEKNLFKWFQSACQDGHNAHIGQLFFGSYDFSGSLGEQCWIIMVLLCCFFFFWWKMDVSDLFFLKVIESIYHIQSYNPHFFPLSFQFEEGVRVICPNKCPPKFFSQVFLPLHKPQWKKTPIFRVEFGKSYLLVTIVIIWYLQIIFGCLIGWVIKLKAKWIFLLTSNDSILWQLNHFSFRS